MSKGVLKSFGSKLLAVIASTLDNADEVVVCVVLGGWTDSE